MRIGYIRVSTDEQNISRQETLMKDLDVEKLFIEKVSGKDRNRPELKKMMEFARDGDTVVIESYSRLARSTRDLLDIVEELEKNKVSFISQKENFDTTTPQGKLILTIFAGLSEFERTVMLERQREGIAEAKRLGKYKGRKPIEINMVEFKKVYSQWKAGEIMGVEAQKMLSLTASTFYRRVKDFEKRHEKNKGSCATRVECRENPPKVNNINSKSDNDIMHNF